MSATSFALLDVLNARSANTKAGFKKSVKATASRAARRSANVNLAKDLEQAMAGDLSNATAEELERYADAMLWGFPPDDTQSTDDAQSFAMLEGVAGQEEPVPAELLGALPSWMVEQLDAAKGNAFDLLALFESKRVSPTAAISMVDEAAEELFYA